MPASPCPCAITTSKLHWLAQVVIIFLAIYISL
jgi:hypothetical protein